MEKTPDAFIFMKVGNHANESWEDILERKKREYESAGRIFWGYGGATCHPLHQIQPFARLQTKKRNGIYLLMEPINSNAAPDLFPANEYSEDGIHWEPIPEGIEVRGSRYALILDEIKPQDLEIHLEDYAVGVGQSIGKPASDYVRGRVDKGCFETAHAPVPIAADGKPRRIQYAAEILEPFAVMLR